MAKTTKKATKKPRPPLPVLVDLHYTTLSTFTVEIDGNRFTFRADKELRQGLYRKRPIRLEKGVCEKLLADPRVQAIKTEVK